MGMKRWLLALLILVVVLGFIFFIFLQTGADEQIAEVVIPKIEERFQVSVEYDSVSVSLTSVSFNQVVLKPRSGAGPKKALPFATIERLGIHFRVGPLLLGKLDITGVRVDGLQMRVGKGANGASIAQWRSLLQMVNRDDQNESGAAATQRQALPFAIPEIYLVSGEAHFNDSRFSGSALELNGRITPGNKAVIQAQKWVLGDARYTSAKGDHLDLDYDFDLHHLSITIRRPGFTIPGDSKRFAETASLLNKTVTELGLSSDATEEKTAELQDNARPALDVAVKIQSASGELTDKDGEKLIELQNFNAELLSSKKVLLSARASSGLAGTDARWALQGTIPRNGEPSLVIEIPDLPLQKLGGLLYDGEHVDWSSASADSQIKLNMNAEGTGLVLEGQTSVAGVTVSHPRIAPSPLKNLNAMFDFKTTYDFATETLHLERLQVSQNMARIVLRGDVQLNRLAFDVTANIPSTSCRQILDVIPANLTTELTGVELEGQLGMEMHLAFDVQNPDAMILDANVNNRCKIAQYGSVLRPDDLRRPFAYMAYDEDGNRIRLTTGPGTNRWTPYSQISPFLMAAVLTTEDGKFEHHSGVTLPEIRRAFLLNWKKDGMLHGGSTITMQLAKNLFLSRDRTVARKLQELFFVWYLESNFTKEEILELYFNVIEFGPSLYGIGEAALHYFGRDPSELNLMESVFLIKLLPNPVARHREWEEHNELGERKTKSLQRILVTMLKRKRITEAEYNEGMHQTVSFYKEGMPLPEPRIPVHRSWMGGIGYSDDEAAVVDDPMDENW